MSTRMPLLGTMVLVACLSSTAVFADPIRVSFDVTVTFTQGTLQDIFGVPVTAGDVIRGSFTMDPAAPDQSTLADFGAYSGVGQHLRLDAGTGVTLPVERYFVYDNFSCLGGFCDAFQVSASTTMFSGFEFIGALLDFRTPGANRDGDGLPRDAAELAALFTSAQLVFDAMLPNQDVAEFTHRFAGVVQVRTAEPTPVPEFGTLVLVGSGLAAICARRARRARLSRSR